MRNKWCMPHPATMFFLLTLGIIFLSWIFDVYGLNVRLPQTGEEIRVQSLLSPEGLRWLLRHVVTNFTGFAPLGLVIVAMFGIRCWPVAWPGMAGAGMAAPVFCADCGGTMVLHRAHTMSASYNHFTCRTYKKDGEACTGHYIRECVLDEIVLEDLRRVTSAAREHPEKFAAYIGSKQSAELQREIRRQEKELAAMRKRKTELDTIFKKLYEDSVLGRITTEQFQMLSGSYTEEQSRITAGIPQKESEIQCLRETVSGTDSFLDKAKRYTDITELTPELLRLFIEKIVVHEKEVKWSKHTPQTVEIYYNGIGYVGSGQQDVEEALEAPESLQTQDTEKPRQAS